MNNKQILIGVVGIIIGALLVNFIPGTMFSRYGNEGFGMMDGNQFAGNINLSNIDRHFIEQMIPHHDGAITMANLALQKASRPEIKTLAQAILKAQTAENQEMRSWYKDWFGKNLPTNGNVVMGGMMSQGGMHMGSVQDVDTLENASDFDKGFIEQMIPHHQMAIMMAQMLEAGTDRPEMLDLAKNITSSQSKEIEEMRNWYQLWYGNN